MGRLAPLAIVLAALLAYGGIFSCPFVMDDVPAITANPTIAHLWGALAPPRQLPVSGRPLLNFSYAVNYAIGGFGVGGYHAFNLMAHILSALAVFGIVRRTLARPDLCGRFGGDRVILALLVAGLWAVHPLNTEAVTYVSERAESLMGLFYLATLYLFVRGEESRRPAGWYVLSVLACLLGALTKEVIATAPLVVLLYDRTFCAGSFAGGWRLRWRYYLGLAAAWPLLAYLALGTGERGVGFGNGVGGWPYALTSCRSVVTYLKLSVWPHPLVFDYGTAVVSRPGEVAPYALVLAALLLFSAVALRRWPATGFACAWFFVILAPTSSVIPLAFQPTAEHRAYLPLLAVVCLGVLCLYRCLGRRGAVLLAALAVLLGWLSFQRNRVYASELALWSDTVAKEPGNQRARVTLGAALAKMPGRVDEAVSEYEEALHIKPDYAEAHNNLGLVLASTYGRYTEAVSEFEEAVRDKPGYFEAHDNMGMALAHIPGRLNEAISEYEASLRINPGYAKAHNDLGIALAGTPGRLPEAVVQFEEALRIRPDFPDAQHNLETARDMLHESADAPK